MKKDEKALRTALSKEIRDRKYSSFSIKFDNPLFVQKKLDVPALINNLKLLLMKTDISLAAKATMEDLEAVIGVSNAENSCQESANGTTLDIDEEEIVNTDHLPDSDWPPPIGYHIAANFSDGFYIGQVESVIDSQLVMVSYMHPRKVLTTDLDEHSRRFWFWPSIKDKFKTKRSYILNLKPSICLATPPSTTRILVFACNNVEPFDTLASSITEDI